MTVELAVKGFEERVELVEAAELSQQMQVVLLKHWKIIMPVCLVAGAVLVELWWEVEEWE